MSKNILLNIDGNFSGYGDMTNLLRIGKFLISKGYTVYATIATMSSKDVFIPSACELFKNERDIKFIVSPADLDFLIKITEEITNHEFDYMIHSIEDILPVIESSNDSHAVGLSLDIFESLEKFKENVSNNKITLNEVSNRLNKIFKAIKKTTILKFDFEISVFGTLLGKKNGKSILIGQYSGDYYMKHFRDRFNYLISPISKEKREGILHASFHSHNSYTVLPRKKIVGLLKKNKSMRPFIDHLSKSSWGSYYSGTLGTNGLFFKLLNISLPKMLKKHGMVTYFSFLDNKHFNKYVLPYLDKKTTNIVDLTNTTDQTINFNKKNNCLVINLFAQSSFMEAIINESELFSVSAGDGSFNIMFNHMCNNKKFSMFKYYNNDQWYFFKFLVDTMCELEDERDLGHDWSKAFFAFGFNEKIFKHHYSRNNKMDGITQFEIYYPKESTLEEDMELMSRMFYDQKFISVYNWIMSEIIPFVKEVNPLYPVEDILLAILENEDLDKFY